MDVKALDYFIALAEEKNMRKAAERLFISQQGLSRIIINLEKEMECDLFERKRSGMELTPSGERLYETARRVRTELVELRRDISQIMLERPLIRIACAFGTLHILYPLLIQFKEQHPEIDVQWSECVDDDCENRLDSQEVDIAFNVYDREKRKYIIERLCKFGFTMLINEDDPLYEADQVSIEDLKGRRLISVGTGFHMFNVLKQRCLDYGFYPEVETGIKEIDLIHRLVSIGEGTGISVEFISDMIYVPGVRAKKFSEDGLTWEIALERRKDCKMTPSLQLFWDYIKEYAVSL